MSKSKYIEVYSKETNKFQLLYICKKKLYQNNIL